MRIVKRQVGIGTNGPGEKLHVLGNRHTRPMTQAQGFLSLEHLLAPDTVLVTVFLSRNCDFGWSIRILIT
jgi:hypothetical protein